MSTFGMLNNFLAIWFNTTTGLREQEYQFESFVRGASHHGNLRVHSIKNPFGYHLVLSYFI